MSVSLFRGFNIAVPPARRDLMTAKSRPMPAGTARRNLPGAEKFLPASPRASLKVLREAAQHCRGCDLYKNATQAVVGEGPRTATIFLIGEQPGDQEDKQGRPFVGPAGALLDRALADAGIDRSQVYVTNAVKHFKWTPSPRGKRRLHSKPSAGEVTACRPWLEREIQLFKPKLLVALGATAGQSLMGSSFRVTKSRGQPIRENPWGITIIATVHPSAILRAPDDESRRREYAAFVEDLKAISREANSTSTTT
jgi:DNA polymerase